ncbi:0340ff46-21c8-4056-b192-92b826118123 [Thermothielavioides terrestris]|uniref:0340ff46-21c8-4056-b192-92b826118123 n=1 Tax=Thermothielavioides terrestris TaxID=2587410 RepID=A0A3S4ASP8_9PEZI|nr:0340ff46-21c8-4056-b192-92b826118123 [Thermothielavioides terrestris]
MTVRMHPGAMIGGATLQLSATFTSQDRFNQDASALHAMIPTMSDSARATTSINQTVLAPFSAKLAELGIPFRVQYSTLLYFDYYNTYMGPCLSFAAPITPQVDIMMA